MNAKILAEVIEKRTRHRVSEMLLIDQSLEKIRDYMRTHNLKYHTMATMAGIQNTSLRGLMTNPDYSATVRTIRKLESVVDQYPDPREHPSVGARYS
jgi:predicted hydrolase (HD superfamily)